MRMRLTGIAVALLAAVFAMLALAGSAQATPQAAKEKCPTVQIPSKDDVIQIVGQLNDTRTNPCKPVSGVKITVLNEAGDVLGEATSGADGTFVIPLPGSAIDNLGELLDAA